MSFRIPHSAFRIPPEFRIPTRLVVDAPREGAANMALDDVLLDDAADSRTCWLRFYRWSEPTLSLGYFQAYAERLEHQPSRQAAVVRRSSGGGAILHDHELTYSLAMPGGQGLAGDATRLYTAVHEALVVVLAESGLEASLVPETAAAAAGASPSGAQPFLCFQRRSPGDVLLGGAKICGSAQRRRQGAVLQHGSLILARSAAAPELAGLAEQAQFRPDEAKLTARWSSAIAERLGLELAESRIDSQLIDRMQSIAASKYRADEWTRRR